MDRPVPSNRRRKFLERLGLGSTAAVAAILVPSVAPGTPVTPAEPSVIVPVSLPVAPDIVWTCFAPKCAAENHTPASVWPSVKFNLACQTCGCRQPYAWWLKKVDPSPTEYGASAGHALTGVLDQPRKLTEK